jgi:nucleotide-binding universal stress UspA family protein
MKIKPMLLRLQSALKQDNLSEQMLLYPGSETALASTKAGRSSTNFVIGYNGSPNSQTALDFVLWMAHQTRLATQQQVIVHVVYVIDCHNSLDPQFAPISALKHLGTQSASSAQFSCSTSELPCGTATLARSQKKATQVATLQAPSASTLPGMLEQADRVLWQARCLSDEWRGSLEAHLRFGAVATELRQVAEAEAADLLSVGCTSVNHPLMQQLIPCLSCPILGIPTELESI